MWGSDTPSILDLLLVSYGDLVSDIKQLSPIGKSDHSVIVFSLEKEVLRTRVAPKRNYYKGDYVAMRREFSDVNWIEEFSGLESLDTIYTRFTKIVASMEEQFIPVHNKYTRVALPKANIELIKAKKKHGETTKVIEKVTTERKHSRGSATGFEKQQEEKESLQNVN